MFPSSKPDKNIFRWVKQDAAERSFINIEQNFLRKYNETNYCCVAKEGKSDRAERQNGWKNEDINLAGGWFALLYGGEEESEVYTDWMIIGHIEKEHLATLKKLPNTAKFLVRLA